MGTKEDMDTIAKAIKKIYYSSKELNSENKAEKIHLYNHFLGNL